MITEPAKGRKRRKPETTVRLSCRNGGFGTESVSPLAIPPSPSSNNQNAFSDVRARPADHRCGTRNYKATPETTTPAWPNRRPKQRAEVKLEIIHLITWPDLFWLASHETHYTCRLITLLTNYRMAHYNYTGGARGEGRRYIVNRYMYTLYYYTGDARGEGGGT